VQIKFIVLGKTSFPYLKDGIEIYTKRLKHYTKLQYLEVHVKIPKSANESEVKKLEYKALSKHISSTDKIILLDENGKKHTSLTFSKWIENQQLTNTKNLTFIVGGPYGFDTELITQAQGKISLSEMTFSHQMIRVFFLEQIYRAFTILKGEPYHHA